MRDGWKIQTPSIKWHHEWRRVSSSQLLGGGKTGNRTINALLLSHKHKTLKMKPPEKYDYSYNNGSHDSDMVLAMVRLLMDEGKSIIYGL